MRIVRLIVAMFVLSNAVGATTSREALEGWGKVKFGMTLDQVQSAVGGLRILSVNMAESLSV